MFRHFRRSFELMSRREKTVFGGLLALRIALQGLDVAGLAAVGALVAFAASGPENQQQLEVAGLNLGLISPNDFVLLIFLVAGLFVLKTAFAALVIKAQLKFLAGVEADKAEELSNALFGPDLSRTQAHSRGEIQWLIQVSVGQAFSAVPQSWATILSESLLMLAIVTAFMFVDVPATLAVLAFLLVTMFFFQLFFGKRAVMIGERLAQLVSLVNTRLFDLGDALRELTVLGKTRIFIKSTNELRRQTAFLRADQRFILSMPRYLIEAVVLVGVVTLISWQLVIGDGEQNLPLVAVFLTGGARIAGAIVPVQNAVNALKSAGPQGTAAQKQLRAARKSRAIGAVLSPASRPKNVYSATPIAIKIDQVSFTYPGASRPAVSRVSLQLPPGSSNALVGPSGAGKSTLADICMGLQRPQEGTVTTSGGKQVTALLREAPGRIAYVPQRPGLISGTIAQNVALSSNITPGQLSRVEEVIEQVGLAQFVSELPNGVKAELGEQSEKLSGGQRQRIGVARALFSRPGLIVLDEVTSALDAYAESELTRMLRGLSKEATLLIIAHRMTTVAFCDTIFVLENGELRGSGEFHAIRKSSPFVRFASSAWSRDTRVPEE